jgi:hypothetical protein
MQSFLGAFAKLRQETITFVRSVCSSILPSVRMELTPIGRIFMKYNTTEFFENLSRKPKFHRSLTKITGMLHEYE